MPAYQSALLDLRHHQVARVQTQIEITVLELQAMHLQRERAGPVSKETKRLMSQKAVKRRKLDDLLGDLHTVSRVAGCLAIVISKEQVTVMLKEGVFPWASGGAWVAASMQVLHGRRFHNAVSDFDRTVEEVELLRVEKARLMLWFPFIMSGVDAAITSTQVPQHAEGGLAEEGGVDVPVEEAATQQQAPGGWASAEVGHGQSVEVDGMIGVAAAGLAESGVTVMDRCAQDSLAQGTVFLLQLRRRELAHMAQFAGTELAFIP